MDIEKEKNNSTLHQHQSCLDPGRVGPQIYNRVDGLACLDLLLCKARLLVAVEIWVVDRD
uniref:Uncharacterized protein n=1 Tax=Rhizophora mucronata TaxID=61149 RepID=A0A2P2JWW9_RHIMU